MFYFHKITIFIYILISYSNCHEIKEDEDGEPQQGMWAEKLIDLALDNHRQSRIIMIPISAQDAQAQKRQDTNATVESKISPGPTKIVNNNNNRPHITETDMYLLGAIEKLVYRVDFMEKRLRRMEEMLYYVMAGNRIDTEPCPDNFTRVASQCYHFGSDAGREYDWKIASKYCKRLGGYLAEMETIEENQDLVTYIQTQQHLKGKDFWLGGLNPGLLWIWSNSARPVAIPGQSLNKPPNVKGEGRCLRLAYNPALRSYEYKASDCSLRYHYVCELTQNTSSNEIKRIGRSRKILEEL